MRKQEDANEHMYAVLTHYGWTLNQSKRGWHTVKCHAHDDGHASCRVNLDIGQVKCMSCDFGGDVFNVIAYYDGLDFRGCIERLESIIGGGDRRVRAASAPSGQLPVRKRDHGRHGKTVPPRLLRRADGRA